MASDQAAHSPDPASHVNAIGLEGVVTVESANCGHGTRTKKCRLLFAELKITWITCKEFRHNLQAGPHVRLYSVRFGIAVRLTARHSHTMAYLQCELPDLQQDSMPPDPEMVDLIRQAYLEGLIDGSRAELACLWAQNCAICARDLDQTLPKFTGRQI